MTNTWSAGESLKELRYPVDRQPDNVRIRPLEARDEPRRQALDGVAAGLIPSFAARHVPVDIKLRQRREPDGRHVDLVYFERTASQADARQDAMLAARQQPQHPSRFVIASWFPQDRAVHDHGRVGPQ